MKGRMALPFSFSSLNTTSVNLQILYSANSIYLVGVMRASSKAL
jgi:hypothetical protein